MLLKGINHVAILTKDTDRLHAFYRDVFEATVFHDQTNGDMRLSFVDVGPHTRLNVFEIRGNVEAERQVPMSAVAGSITSAWRLRRSRLSTPSASG